MLRIKEVKKELEKLDFGRNVCISHVRRGDYLLQNSIFDMLGKYYYQTALEIIYKKNFKTKVVLISDEPENALNSLD